MSVGAPPPFVNAASSGVWEPEYDVDVERGSNERIFGISKIDGLAGARAAFVIGEQQLIVGWRAKQRVCESRLLHKRYSAAVGEPSVPFPSDVSRRF